MPSEKEGKDMISTAEFGKSAIMELEWFGMWLLDGGCWCKTSPQRCPEWWLDPCPSPLQPQPAALLEPLPREIVVSLCFHLVQSLNTGYASNISHCIWFIAVSDRHWTPRNWSPRFFTFGVSILQVQMNPGAQIMPGFSPVLLPFVYGFFRKKAISFGWER